MEERGLRKESKGTIKRRRRNRRKWKKEKDTSLSSNAACVSWRTEVEKLVTVYVRSVIETDRLCGLVGRIAGYTFRGPEFDSRR
jgi:hypothetical protein